MKKESMRKYSLLGLVLIGASAVAAAVVPNNKDKGTSGRLQASANGLLAQLTCSKDQAVGNLCTWTATQGVSGVDGEGSRTSTVGTGKDLTSSITNALGAKVKTISSNASGPDQDINHTSFN
jgi:hypothetical protein